MNNINWDGFRYFIAAAETGSLSAAAKQLNSNQPTVGRHIDALESALGVKLFQRHVRGLTLTQEGAYIFEQSQHMRTALLKIQRTIGDGQSQITGTVRIAIPEGLCMEILVPALPEFYRQYPEINLIVNVSASTANLTSGEADIAVRLFRPKEVNLVVKRLGNMSMGLYASRGYCHQRGAPETLEDLRKHSVITYGDQFGSLAENQWLIQHSDPGMHIVSSDNTTTRLKSTLTGLGISVQPDIFQNTNTDLVRLLEGTEIPAHEVWLVYHHDLRHSARVRAVVDFISSIIEL